MVVDKDVDGWRCGQREVDLEDKPIYQANDRQRVIATVSCLTIDTEDYGSRTKIGKKARRMLMVAQAYEDAVDEAKARSGLTAAIEAREAAAAAVDKLAGEIAEAKARTMEGVMIKARAMSACILLGDAARFVAAFRGGHDLAETVSRVAAEHADPGRAEMDCGRSC